MPINRGGRLLLALALLAPLFSFPQPVKAASASYSFSPSNIRLNVGQTATVTLLLSTDQPINAADGTIVLPSNYVSGSGINKTGSLFVNWPEEPTVNGSSIRFAGGLPTPGYQGTGGKVFSFTIRGTAEGTGLITLSGGRILANNATSTNIYSGSGTATVSVTRVVSGASISSSTHPDQAKWYTGKNLSLSWSKPSGASQFSYTLTHSGGQPSKTGNTNTTSASFNDLADGVWTFSLTTTYSDGKTASSSFVARIDTVAPEPFTVSVKQENGAADQFPIFSYLASDQGSGIDHYEVVIDSREPISTTEPTLKPDKLPPGKHRVKVIAYDKAGNKTEATAEFTIEGFPGPTLISVSRFVSVLQPVIVKGRALSEATIHLYVNGKKEAEFNVKENLTDAQRQRGEEIKDGQEVEWSYAYKGLLLPGSHEFYAIQVKPDGSESNPSNTLKSRVLWSTITLGGLNIPMALLAIIAVILLIGLGLFLLWTYRHTRRAVGGWKNRLTNLRKRVDEELVEMESDINKASEQLTDTPTALRRQIGSEVKGTIKEVDQSLDAIIEIADKQEGKSSEKK